MAGGRALWKKEQKARKEARGDSLRAEFEKACKAYDKSGTGEAKAEVYRCARELKKLKITVVLPGGL